MIQNSPIAGWKNGSIFHVLELEMHSAKRIALYRNGIAKLHNGRALGYGL